MAYNTHVPEFIPPTKKKIKQKKRRFEKPYFPRGRGIFRGDFFGGGYGVFSRRYFLHGGVFFIGYIFQGGYFPQGVFFTGGIFRNGFSSSGGYFPQRGGRVNASHQIIERYPKWHMQNGLNVTVDNFFFTSFTI